MPQPTPVAPVAKREDAASTLLPIPFPDLTKLETAVAEQLQTAQDALSSIQMNAQAGTARRFKAYGDLGRLYHAYNLWDAAEACYRNAITLVPSSFEMHYLLAHALQQAGRIEAALDAYTAALRLRPGHVITNLRMVEVLLLLNRPQQAREHLAAAQQSAPGLTAAVVMQGEFALTDKNYQLAIELLQKALAAAPKADRLHYLLAQAYRGAGQTGKAREHLSHSGTVGVRIPDPLVDELEQLARGERVAILQGRLAYNAGDYKSAAEYFRRALAEAPESISARVNLGASLERIGDTDSAIAQFRKVLEAEPDNMSANFNLAELLLKQRDYAGAAQYYERVLEARQGDAQAQLGMARARSADNKPLEAYRHYQQVIMLAPQLTSGWIELAELLINNKRYREAGDVLKQAYEKFPADGLIVHTYARFLAAVPDTSLRDGPRALDLAQMVFKASPTLLHGETLAMAYAQAGQCGMAAQIQQKIIDGMAGNQSVGAGEIEKAKRILGRYNTARPCQPPAVDF